VATMILRSLPQALAQMSRVVSSRPYPEALSRPYPEASSRPYPEALSRPYPEASSRPYPEALSRLAHRGLRPLL